MKTLVRPGTFETNSSSAHSLSVAKDYNRCTVYETIIPDEEGIIYVHGGDFGWGPEEYNDAKTKLAYALQSLGGCEREMLIDIVKEVTCAKEVTHNGEGYIDHQSDDKLATWLRKQADKRAALKDFIFNKNSWVIIDNDNDGYSFTRGEFPDLQPDGSSRPLEYKYKVFVDGIMLRKYFSASKIKENFDDLVRDWSNAHDVSVHYKESDIVINENNIDGWTVTLPLYDGNALYKHVEQIISTKYNGSYSKYNELNETHLPSFMTGKHVVIKVQAV